MNFQYFFPSQSKITNKLLTQTRLVNVIDTNTQQRPQTTVTIDNECLVGLLIQRGETVPIISKSTTWQKVAIYEDAPVYYIGYDADSLPTPEELMRAEMFPHFEIAKINSQHWYLPVAMLPTTNPASAHNFPTQVTATKSGKIQQTILPEFHKLWDIASRYFSTRFEACSKMQEAGELEVAWDISSNNLLEDFVEILKVNYHIGIMEATILDLLNNVNAQQIFDTFIDWNGWLGLAKSNAKKKH